MAAASSAGGSSSTTPSFKVSKSSTSLSASIRTFYCDKDSLEGCEWRAKPHTRNRGLEITKSNDFLLSKGVSVKSFLDTIDDALIQRKLFKKVDELLRSKIEQSRLAFAESAASLKSDALRKGGFFKLSFQRARMANIERISVTCRGRWWQHSSVFRSKTSRRRDLILFHFDRSAIDGHIYNEAGVRPGYRVVRVKSKNTSDRGESEIRQLLNEAGDSGEEYSVTFEEGQLGWYEIEAAEDELNRLIDEAMHRITVLKRKAAKSGATAASGVSSDQPSADSSSLPPSPSLPSLIPASDLTVDLSRSGLSQTSVDRDSSSSGGITPEAVKQQSEPGSVIQTPTPGSVGASSVSASSEGYSPGQLSARFKIGAVTLLGSPIDEDASSQPSHHSPGSKLSKSPKSPGVSGGSSTSTTTTMSSTSTSSSTTTGSKTRPKLIRSSTPSTLLKGTDTLKKSSQKRRQSAEMATKGAVGKRVAQSLGAMRGSSSGSDSDTPEASALRDSEIDRSKDIAVQFAQSVQISVDDDDYDFDLENEDDGPPPKLTRKITPVKDPGLSVGRPPQQSSGPKGRMLKHGKSLSMMPTFHVSLNRSTTFGDLNLDSIEGLTRARGGSSATHRSAVTRPSSKDVWRPSPEPRICSLCTEKFMCEYESSNGTFLCNHCLYPLFDLTVSDHDCINVAPHWDARHFMISAVDTEDPLCVKAMSIATKTIEQSSSSESKGQTTEADGNQSDDEDTDGVDKADHSGSVRMHRSVSSSTSSVSTDSPSTDDTDWSSDSVNEEKQQSPEKKKSPKKKRKTKKGGTHLDWADALKDDCGDRTGSSSLQAPKPSSSSLSSKKQRKNTKLISLVVPNAIIHSVNGKPIQPTHSFEMFIVEFYQMEPPIKLTLQRHYTSAQRESIEAYRSHLKKLIMFAPAQQDEGEMSAEPPESSATESALASAGAKTPGAPLVAKRLKPTAMAASPLGKGPTDITFQQSLPHPISGSASSASSSARSGGRSKQLTFDQILDKYRTLNLGSGMSTKKWNKLSRRGSIRSISSEGSTGTVKITPGAGDLFGSGTAGAGMTESDPFRLVPSAMPALADSDLDTDSSSESQHSSDSLHGPSAVTGAGEWHDSNEEKAEEKAAVEGLELSDSEIPDGDSAAMMAAKRGKRSSRLSSTSAIRSQSTDGRIAAISGARSPAASAAARSGPASKSTGVFVHPHAFKGRSDNTYPEFADKPLDQHPGYVDYIEPAMQAMNDGSLKEAYELFKEGITMCESTIPIIDSTGTKRKWRKTIEEWSQKMSQCKNRLLKQDEVLHSSGRKHRRGQSMFVPSTGIHTSSSVGPSSRRRAIGSRGPGGRRRTRAGTGVEGRKSVSGTPSAPPPASAPDESKETEKDGSSTKTSAADSEFRKRLEADIVDASPNIHFKDVYGLLTVKLALYETVILPQLKPEFFSGLRKPSSGLLLFGPPGNGKTMIAKCVASEVKGTFFSISASSITSKFVGEAERIMRTLFNLAREKAPSIIFIDEIDSLLRARGGANEAESSRRIKTEFLIQFDGVQSAKEAGKSLLVVGATNLPAQLDDAVLRRFGKRICVPLPDSDARYGLLRSKMQKQKHNLSEEDFQTVVEWTRGYSGSDMANLCTDAAMGPIRSLGAGIIGVQTLEEMEPIGLKHFKQSVGNVRPSVPAESLKMYSEWDAKYGSKLSFELSALPLSMHAEQLPPLKSTDSDSD